MSDWANKAAVLANSQHQPVPAAGSSNTHTAPPELGSASAKAALLAHKASTAPKKDSPLSANAAKESIREAKERGALSAASQSFTAQSNRRKESAHLSEQAAQESQRKGKERALMAATKSFGTPKSPERTATITNSARKSMELAQKRVDSRQQESNTRHGTIHIRAEMLTEHPPIRMEVEEKEHKDALRASAISLARSVYNPTSANNADPKHKPMQYNSLQEQAQKLATERLSKIKNPDEHADYRNYYGVGTPARSRSTRTNSVLQKIRHPKSQRSSSFDEDDINRSQRVRSQMAALQSDIEKVDAQRATQDRARLMQAAQKKVTAQMHKMDDDVFRETGKMSPIMMSEWEIKSRQRLQQQRQTNVREIQPDSAVNVGAGKLVDRAEIEDLANARVGPTLKGIDQVVERRKAEDAAKLAEAEEAKRQAHLEKETKKEEKAEKKRMHAEEKHEKKLQEQRLKTAGAVEAIIHTEGERSEVTPTDVTEPSPTEHASPKPKRFSNLFHKRSSDSHSETRNVVTTEEHTVIKTSSPSAEVTTSTHLARKSEVCVPEEKVSPVLSPETEDKKQSKLRKAFQRRSKDETELERDYNDKTKKPSKIKSALNKLQRKPKGRSSVAAVNARTENGESTELEEPSDTDSFHSTTESAPTTTAEPTHQGNASPVISTDEHSKLKASQRASSVYSEADREVSDVGKEELRQGSHVGTKFHEEL